MNDKKVHFSEFVLAAFGILSIMMPVMLPGAVVIAIISYVRKRKGEKN